MINLMLIDHICFAVKDVNEGMEYWGKVFGYSQHTKVVENSVQKVKVVFLSKPGSITIKLIEPVKDNKALQNFVNNGGGFHHLCFRCDDVNQGLKELTGKGLLCLAKPQSGEAFNGHSIAFLLAKYGMRIELIDTDEKACLL